MFPAPEPLRPLVGQHPAVAPRHREARLVHGVGPLRLGAGLGLVMVLVAAEVGVANLAAAE